VNATGAASLKVLQLHKQFETGAEPVPVLRGITFDMEAAASLAITGPSGSGKSTLLHVIGTLDRPTSGQVLIDGQDPHRMEEPELAAFRNRTIGFVFQDHHLLRQYSVLENVLIPTFAAPGASEGTERARTLLDRVGLSHRLHHRPAELSGGERQRAAVARALIRRPGLLLCDEPTGNLDRKSAEAVSSLLFDLHREEGNLLITVTHSLELAARFDRRFELAEGLCSAR
jgi:lipoprotein-releasing system ATP-binding protein